MNVCNSCDKSAIRDLTVKACSTHTDNMWQKTTVYEKHVFSCEIYVLTCKTQFRDSVDR